MKIPLTADCFDSLDVRCTSDGTNQFVSNDDCPIARSIKKTTKQSLIVTALYVMMKVKGKGFEDLLLIKGNAYEVERCREELLAGAEVAYIEVTKILNRDLIPEALLNVLES